MTSTDFNPHGNFEITTNPAQPLDATALNPIHANAEYGDSIVANLFTATITAKVDPRQTLPSEWYVYPEAGIRKLRAKLILEEALEFIHGLGFNVSVRDELVGMDSVSLDPLPFPKTREEVWKRMEAVIDGGCDLKFVIDGTMLACGIPQDTHMAAVCLANISKFPEGKAIVDPATGKYLKPEGWQPPNHLEVKEHLTPFLPPDGWNKMGAMLVDLTGQCVKELITDMHNESE